MDSKLTLQKITEECQRMVNLKLDASRIKERDISQILSVRPSKEKHKRFSTPGGKGKKTTITALNA